MVDSVVAAVSAVLTAVASHPAGTAVVGAAFLVLPPLLILVRLVWLVRWRRKPFLHALLRPGLLVSSALILIVYTSVVYVIGLFYGSAILDAGETCASRAGFYSGTPGPPDSAWTGIDRNFLPLQSTCQWSDHTTYELVPGWVNPVFYALLTMAWLALLARPLATLIAPGRLARPHTVR